MSPYKFLPKKVTTFKKRKLVKGLVIVAVLFPFSFFLLDFFFPLPDKIAYTTVVTDNRGEMIHAFLTPDEKWRMKTELHEISPLLRKTILAKEDKYFYSHPGINVFAIARASFNNLRQEKRTSGASTITMQVARALEHRKRTWPNKALEAFRALQLEWKYSKEEIFQLYLNLVPYGGNIEGVKAASYLYFKKAPNHLSLAEITALSIIPNRPSSLVIGKNNKVIKEERNKWLLRFARQKLFTPKEIEDALAEPLHAERSAVPHYAPHLSFKLKKNSQAPLLSTTLRLNLQLKAEKLTADYIRSLKGDNIHNAAVVIMENKTGQVISYIGSADFSDTTDGGQVNGAAAVRQPGSTLKPLLYGICMDEGLLTPKRMLTDVPVNYNGFAPENYDQQFNGYVSVEYALAHSLNIPSVKSLHLLGKDKFIQTLSAAGFTQIEKNRNSLGLSLVLGGCGTTLEQLTALFSAFANNGVYKAPVYVTNQPPSKRVRILSPPASYLITDMLSKVNRPDFPLNWQATENMPKIAWKTGTSYGRKDAWSIGYNKQYTIGVWIGNFSATGSPALSGANSATPLLFRLFNTLDYSNNGDWFSPPPGCDLRKVCSQTGLLPGEYCTNEVMDYFIPLVSSSATCTHIQEIKVAPDSSLSYCAACVPPYGYIKKRYVMVASEMQDYFSQNGMAYTPVPPHNPSCEKIFRGDGPAITSPANGGEYFISLKDPEPIQLSATTGNDVSKIFWYIDDEFYKATPAGTKQFFIPKEGPVKISCTDDKGRNRNIWIRVKKVDL